MARIIRSADIIAGDYGPQERHWIYNGLDSCITREVWDTLRPRLDPVLERTYKFEMALQAPAMSMMLRGVAVDLKARSEGIETLKRDYEAAVVRVNALVAPIWDKREADTGLCAEGGHHNWPRGEADETRRCKKCNAPRLKLAPFNPNSSHDAKHLFYTLLKVAPQRNKKGDISTDKEALDKIARKSEAAAPIVAQIKDARKISKARSMLETGLSADGRMRSSFNVGAAWTGRFSSSENPFSEGGNLQNIPEKLRYIFTADPGWTMFYADLEQAESCCVAYLSGDENYIAAHLGGDVHTYVARLIWPELPWTGDMAKDKLIADGTNPSWDREHSYRYNAKRIQHGSNFLLTSRGLARIAHIPFAAAREGQDRYFDAFPGIRLWHWSLVAEQRETMTLTTPIGRRFTFLGRSWDTHTKKQGAASKPQSMVADILDAAMWLTWNDLDPERVQLLAQVHDAILGQYRNSDKTAEREIMQRMRVPVRITDINGKERLMTIATDLKRGQNWGKFNADPKKGRVNLKGMK